MAEAHRSIPTPRAGAELRRERDLPLPAIVIDMVYFQEINDPLPPPLPDFEFDEAKSLANLGKHGIDFETAKALWLDPKRREVPARSEGEPRSAVIGLVGGKHWTAFITYRGSKVRLISVRRSRPREVARYDHHD